MVYFATAIGCILEVDPIIMGVVVLAPGTSVPDALASMIVARQGFGDMAIANALGSNVFDILLGLGLPWFLAELVFGVPVIVDAAGILSGVIILLSTVALFVGTMAAAGWKMHTRVAVVYVVLYVVYILFTLIEELCLVGNFGKCPRGNYVRPGTSRRVLTS